MVLRDAEEDISPPDTLIKCENCYESSHFGVKTLQEPVKLESFFATVEGGVVKFVNVSTVSCAVVSPVEKPCEIKHLYNMSGKEQRKEKLCLTRSTA